MKKNILVLLVGIFLMVSCVTTTNYTLNENESFVVSFSSDNEIELKSFNYGMSDYRGYSLMVEQKYIVFQYVVNNCDGSNAISQDMLDIAFYSYNTIDKEVRRGILGMVDFKNDLLNTPSERNAGFESNIGDIIKIVYSYSVDSVPYKIEINGEEYVLLDETDPLLDDISSFNNDEELYAQLLEYTNEAKNEEVKNLIESNNLDINYSYGLKPSPIIIASAMGNIELVKYFTEIGASPYKLWKSPQIVPSLNAISASVYYNQVAVIEYFIDNDVELDNTSGGAGWNPLLVSAHTNNVILFEKLLNAGADIHAVVKYANRTVGFSVLDIATQSSADDIINYINQNELIVIE